MPARKDPDASTSVPCFYGAELRYKREQAGLTPGHVPRQSRWDYALRHVPEAVTLRLKPCAALE